ncbi:outer membrane protein assembly factor BamB family protein [Runella limosa]|uniref:outer membrane protein assembly factor BamB family protein n=1 Tax=Runella limosa TaxID=370978 RepID=UPI00146FB8A9|nr:PQQ-binding-like beta-propeller repeat protein [Runella limosa]
MVTLIGVTMTSCKERINLEKVDENGVVFQKKPIWKVPTSSDGINPANGVIGNIFIQNALLSTFNENSASLANHLCLQNTETGECKWRWRDVIRPTEEIMLHNYQGHEVYQYQNLLLYQYGPRNYCINVETGTTVWKKTTGYSGVGLCYGLGAQYFTFGTPIELYKGIWEQFIYRGDVLTGKEEKILMPNYSRKHVGLGITPFHVGSINDVRPVVEGKDTLLLITYTELGSERNEYEAYLSLYNLTQQKWLYDRKSLWGGRKVGVLNGAVRLRGDKMYTITSNEVVCHNWRTGDRVWIKVLPSFAEIQGIFEDRYMVLYDSMSTLYCVDADTGEQIWKLPNETLSYTSSYYAGGILYYLSKGRLRARELKTTKLLWDIPSDTDGKLDGHFWVFVTGLPGKDGEKGRIFTRTGYHTYCFEAIK